MATSPKNKQAADWPVNEGEEELTPKAQVTHTPAPTVPPVDNSGDDEGEDKELPPLPPVQQKQVAVEAPLPKTLKESLELLRVIEHSPERIAGKTNEENKTRSQLRLKDLARIRAHVFSLQQGCGVVHIGANGNAKAQAGQAVSLKRERWEMLAKTNPIAAEILEAHDALLKAQTTQTTQ